MRSLLLTNPRASRVAKRGSRLRALADRTGADYALIEGELFDVSGYDRIFIEGGDGTLQRTLSQLLSRGRVPDIVLVSGGTTNQAASVLAPNETGLTALEPLLSGRGTQTQVPLLEVETEGSTAYGFLLSTGAIPQVTQRVTNPDGGQSSSGLALVGKAIVSATRPGSQWIEPSELRVQASCDDEHVVLDGPHLGTVMTTLPSLYHGLDPFWGEGSGALRLTYTASGAQGLLPTILGLWAGRNNEERLRSRGYQSLRAHSVTLDLSSPAILDGEVVEATRLKVRASEPVTFIS